MSRGWDNGGYHMDSASSFRLVCGSPPGVGGGGGEVEGVVRGYRPNSFCGLTPWDLSPPAIPVGVANFSFETWSLWKLLNSPTADTFFEIGYLIESVPAPGFATSVAAIRFDTGTWVASGRYSSNAGVATVATGFVATPGWWSHLVLNCNRAGNMDIYVNGRLLGAVAIDAVNLGSPRFYALSGASPNENTYNDNNLIMWDWTAFTQARVMTGPISVHSRLMTLPEILSSFRGRRVQNFGAPVTRASWDWRLIERIDGDPIEWTFDELMMQEAVVSGIEGLGISAPVGDAATIRVPDLSGSDNHWVLPTLDPYASRPLVAGRARVSFITHPFWMSY